jgi:hypothetical protein
MAAGMPHMLRMTHTDRRKNDDFMVKPLLKYGNFNGTQSVADMGRDFSCSPLIGCLKNYFYFNEYGFKQRLLLLFIVYFFY